MDSTSAFVFAIRRSCLFPGMWKVGDPVVPTYLSSCVKTESRFGLNVEVCHFILLSPRRGPRRSHSADRNSLGRPPPGGPVPSVPGERPAHSCRSARTRRVQVCVFGAATSPRESERGVLSSPWLASLSQFSRHGPPHQAPLSRGAEVARAAGGPSTPADAAPPSTGPAPRIAAPAPPEPLTAPQPRGGCTKGQRLSSSPAGAPQSSAAMLDFGRSSGGEHPRLNPGRHSYQKDPR
ncbi:hypothetical protein NDU88_003608 [Pleurodeles waltl]|uniref:Uncharacterized protein n=1 Tax=Pleurodeles waltl TaxID=8319 RepID=A0AAV7NL46_PLEWA|nr:hypothetical protein NDU88_003608 [Pleurodeles waltl]